MFPSVSVSLRTVPGGQTDREGASETAASAAVTKQPTEAGASFIPPPAPRPRTSLHPPPDQKPHASPQQNQEPHTASPQPSASPKQEQHTSSPTPQVVTSRVPDQNAQDDPEPENVSVFCSAENELTEADLATAAAAQGKYLSLFVTHSHSK